jgi:hypothetical protein
VADQNALLFVKRIPLAVWIWLLYTVVIAGALWFVIAQTDIGVDKSTKREFNPPGTVVSETTSEDHSTFLIGLVTALAGAGWAIIPLKYLWDELAKNADDRRTASQKTIDTNRAERSLVNADRRAIASKMRDLVFDGVTEHFGPMLYRQQSIVSWTGRCIDTKDGATAPTPRLLFALGALEATQDALRVAGRPLLLKSVEKEQEAVKKGRELQTHVYELLGGGRRVRCRLVARRDDREEQGRKDRLLCGV